jgi:hypothetical protein
MKTHYLPQFLLKRFTGEHGLYELDKTSNTCGVRAVKTAGQETDLYPSHVEQGVMGELDQAASKLIRANERNDRIDLRADERVKFVEWLALFWVRVPVHLERFKGHVEEGRRNPEYGVQTLMEHRDECIAKFRERRPDLYTRIISEVGEVEGHQYLLEFWSEMIREGKLDYLPTPEDAFAQHIQSGSFRTIGQRLTNFRWTWLRSDYGFVIGDNPLCRWKLEMGQWDYGVARKKIEVTFPLSRSLCLWMHRNHRHADAAFCNRKWTEKLNRRQIASATFKAYGPSLVHLKPHCKYGIDE